MLEAVHLTFEDGATQSTLTKLPTPTMPPSKVSCCAIHFFLSNDVKTGFNIEFTILRRRLVGTVRFLGSIVLSKEKKLIYCVFKDTFKDDSHVDNFIYWVWHGL